MVRFFNTSIFLLIAVAAFSQINVKIGYGLGILNVGDNNDILAEFNEIKSAELSDSLSIPFKGLKSIHGIDVGLRLKFSENSAIELSWANLAKSTKAIGEINETDLFRQELFYSFNQYYISYQSLFDRYGLGVGIGTNKVKIKDRIGGSEFKETVVSQHQLFTRINLSIYFQSKKTVSFAIQPFIQIPLSDINLSSLRNELKLPADSNASDSFKMIGISFIFYNGRQ
ncbi:MAG: hypothetical protein HKO66_12865 [Saprospiraceae bacterium]|nr:hypothetical protein [Saprospiraceae bacterium]